MESQTVLRRALSLAYNYLAIRQRSEAEMRAHLLRAGLDEVTIDNAVAALTRQGLLDDRSFASAWTESRQASRPRSRRLLNSELRSKGVDADVASSATEAVDDDATAAELARRRVPQMKGLDRGTVMRRLTAYLLRRGFSGETAGRAVRAALADDARS